MMSKFPEIFLTSAALMLPAAAQAQQDARTLVKEDVAQRDFYSVRVLEIPKLSWLAYDAKRFSVNVLDEVPMTKQDRAYTWPICYTP